MAKLWRAVVRLPRVGRAHYRLCRVDSSPAGIQWKSNPRSCVVGHPGRPVVEKAGDRIGVAAAELRWTTASVVPRRRESVGTQAVAARRWSNLLAQLPCLVTHIAPWVPFDVQGQTAMGRRNEPSEACRRGIRCLHEKQPTALLPTAVADQRTPCRIGGRHFATAKPTRTSDRTFSFV